jgi:hypothetical protein
MYPYLWSVPMFGIGIVATVLMFVWIFLTRMRKAGVSPSFFLRNLGYYLVALFVSGTYSYYFLEYGVLVPMHWKQLLLYISPAGFHIHIVGIVVVLAVICVHIYRSYASLGYGRLIVRVLFDAIMLSAVVLGFFLCMSDNFFGIGSSSISLQPLTLESQRAAYDEVVPLGIVVSFLSIACYIMAHRFRMHGKTDLSYDILGIFARLLGLMFITTQQYYPRHGVIELFSLRRDIKQYVFFMLAMLLLWRLFREKNSSQSTP